MERKVGACTRKEKEEKKKRKKEMDSRDTGIHSGRQSNRSPRRLIADISGIYRACIV